MNNTKQTYDVYVKATEYGYTSVKAESLEAAIKGLDEGEIDYDVTWNDRDEVYYADTDNPPLIDRFEFMRFFRDPQGYKQLSMEDKEELFNCAMVEFGEADKMPGLFNQAAANCGLTITCVENPDESDADNWLVHLSFDSKMYLDRVMLKAKENLGEEEANMSNPKFYQWVAEHYKFAILQWKSERGQS